MMIQDSIENILIELGYNLSSEGSRYWRARPIYRSSQNSTSLRIYKDTGFFVDFSANISGSFEELINLSLGLKNIKEAKSWLQNRNFESNSIVFHKPKISMVPTFNDDYPSTLQKNYYFFNKRGITDETLKNFECGVDMTGKMNNRFVFVIRDEEGKIIGLVGRDLLSRGTKWKNMGKKSKWLFPDIALPYIKDKKEVILVESIGDMLALWEAGIKNTMVIFGVRLSNELANLLACLNLKNIIIATNNDSIKEENWGAKAAQGIHKKLCNLVDESILTIKLPNKNDWGETPTEEIKKLLL